MPRANPSGADRSEEEHEIELAERLFRPSSPRSSLPGLTGKTLEGGILHIENLTINVFKDNAQQVNITTPAEALNTMKRILGKKGST